MKTLLISLLFSTTLYASYSKPEMVARYSGIDSFNAPDGLYCFGSEPQPTNFGVFLGCQNADGFVMMKWSAGFEIVAKSENGLFSHPKEVNGQVSWYEFSMAGVSHLFEYKNESLKTFQLKNLGPTFALIDSFTAIKNNSYVYRMEDEAKTLQTWKDHNVSSMFSEEISHIFSPSSSVDGNFIMKVRREQLNEDAPDELLFWDGEFRSVLKDQDMDSTSSIKGFRHQYALDGKKIALVITDALGEAMVILENGAQTVVARAGKDLASFDYFAPKMRNGVLVFRGMDFEKRKVVYVYEEGILRKLLTQGDIVKTDKGLARVDYQSQDALFYGASGIGPRGEIYQQATLTDADSPMTLLGIGLIKFEKE